MFNDILPKASYFHHFSPNPRIFWADPSPNPRPGQIFIHKFVFNGTFTTTSLILSGHGPSLTTAFILGGSISGAAAHKRPLMELGSLQPGSIFYTSVTAPCWRLACNVASVFFMMYIPGECWADWSHSELQIGKQMCGEKKAAGKRCKKRSRDPEKEPWRGTCSGSSERAEVAQKHRQNTSQKESSSS